MKSVNIVLCEKNFGGDIPVYKYNIDKGYSKIIDWLDKRDFDNNVFVSFAAYNNENPKSVLITKSWDDITSFMDVYFDVEEFDNSYFSIYEFDNYKDAFTYCELLKEV